METEGKLVIKKITAAYHFLQQDNKYKGEMVIDGNG